MSTLTLSLVSAAHARIRDSICRTPVFTSSSLDARAGAKLFFKCENFQKVGAFKARGAANVIFSLTEEEAARGVVTFSSGNHGAAVAWAGRIRSIRTRVVMPRDAPRTKIASVKRYGGDVVFCERSERARQSTVRDIQVDTGAVLIHPFDDLRVMAGQGTTAIELLEDVPDLDVILCPVGGGGQLSGVAVAAKTLRPPIRIVGVEPELADDAFRSYMEDRLLPYDGTPTIADGLRTSLSERTFAEIKRNVDAIVTVSEQSIVQAMRAIWGVMKIIVEPSGAVAYSAVMDGRSELMSKKVGIILSGGNLDLDYLPWASARVTAQDSGAP